MLRARPGSPPQTESQDITTNNRFAALSLGAGDNPDSTPPSTPPTDETGAPIITTGNVTPPPDGRSETSPNQTHQASPTNQPKVSEDEGGLPADEGEDEGGLSADEGEDKVNFEQPEVQKSIIATYIATYITTRGNQSHTYTHGFWGMLWAAITFRLNRTKQNKIKVAQVFEAVLGHKCFGGERENFPNEIFSFLSWRDNRLTVTNDMSNSSHSLLTACIYLSLHRSILRNGQLGRAFRNEMEQLNDNKIKLELMLELTDYMVNRQQGGDYRGIKFFNRRDPQLYFTQEYKIKAAKCLFRTLSETETEFNKGRPRETTLNDGRLGRIWQKIKDNNLLTYDKLPSKRSSAAPSPDSDGAV